MLRSTLKWITLLALATCGATKKTFGKLEGVRLKGCALSEVPYITPDVRYRSGLSGLAMDYLSLLKDDLGVTFDLQKCDSKYSWNSLLEHMGNCSERAAAGRPRAPDCDIDIAVGPFSVSDERMRFVHFLQAFDHTGLQVVTLKEYRVASLTNSLWFIIYPFDGYSWLAIFGCIALYGQTSFIFHPFCDEPLVDDAPDGEAHADIIDGDTEAYDDDDEAPAPPRPSFMDSAVRYGHAVGHIMKLMSRSMAQSFAASIGAPLQSVSEEVLVNESLSAAWLLLGISSGLVISTLYQASLSALTFNSAYESPFKSIDDLRGSCGIDIADFGYMGSGYTERYMQRSILEPYFDTCSQAGKWTGRPKRYFSHAEGFRALQEKRIKYFIGPRGSMLFGSQRNCELFSPTGQPFSSSEVAFVVSKSLNSTVVSLLNEGTRILLEENRLESAEVVLGRNSCEDPKDYTMTLPRLFAIFLMFSVVGSVLFMYRIYRLKFRPDRREEDKEFGQ